MRLARWKQPLGGPGWSPKKPPADDWVENSAKPIGVPMMQAGGKWYQWGARRVWEEVDKPEMPKKGWQKQEAAPVLATPPATPPPATTPPATTPAATTPPRPAPQVPDSLAGLPDAALINMLEYLPPNDVARMRATSKRFDALALPVLRAKLEKAFKKTALSSLDGKLQEKLKAKLLELNPTTATVLSDQVSPAVVQDLLTSFPAATRAVPRPAGRGPQTDVYTGKHGQMREGGRAHNVNYRRELHGPEAAQEGSKMHVKSIIGGDAKGPKFLETGSANLTKNAMENNTESVITLKAPGIAKMFSEYATRVAQGKKEDPKFTEQLTGFNVHNPAGIRAALAPFVNVGEQLTTELKGADEVVVRMFLVSDASQGEKNQPLQELIKLAKAGVKVDVTVDKGQAESMGFVRTALGKLRDAGATVGYETGRGAGGIMHDKLVFAHYPERKATAGQPAQAERWTVMIGSSGLTKNVIQNENYENLLIIDDKALYDALWQHHLGAGPNYQQGIPRRVYRE